MELKEAWREEVIARYRNYRMLSYHDLRRTRRDARYRGLDPRKANKRLWWLTRFIKLFHALRYRHLYYQHKRPNV